MSHHPLEYLLNEELTRVQLPPADEMVGRKFFFCCEHGSHAHAFVGTITGIKWSDEAGLKLFVSVPEMWGEPLLCLIRENAVWIAVLPVDRQRPAAGEEFFSGTFRLL